MSTGTIENLQWLKKQLENKYQVKTQIFGPGEGQMREVKILNRIVSWDSAEGILYEADPRHTEIIIEQFGLGDAKTVNIPGTQAEGRTQPGNENKLNANESAKYKAIVARCNYLSLDRPDIAYTVKELARKMAVPSEGDWQRFKRLGRYRKNKPRMQQVYKWQKEQSVLRVYSDADWAVCKESQKSIIGGA